MKFSDAEKPQKTPIEDTTESTLLHPSEFENSAKFRQTFSHFCTLIFKISLIFSIVVQNSPIFIFSQNGFREVSKKFETLEDIRSNCYKKICSNLDLDKT